MIAKRRSRRLTHGERRQYNPFTPLDWRWEVAGRIARREIPWTREPDPALQAAIRLRRRIEQGQPFKRPTEQMKATLKARQVYENDDMLRWEVEARLLVGQSDLEIHRQTGIQPSVIDVYERVFCHVRDCLQASSYLREQAVGDRFCTGFHDNDLKQFWLWLALSGQELVVDEAISVFKNAHHPDEPETVSIYLREDVPMMWRAFVANVVLPLDYPIPGILGTDRDGVESTPPPSQAKSLPLRVKQQLVRAAEAHLAGRPVPSYESTAECVPMDSEEDTATACDVPADAETVDFPST